MITVLPDGELPGRIIEPAKRNVRRRTLTREEYLACIDTAYESAPTRSDEGDALWRALELACERFGEDPKGLRLLRDIGPGDDCADLIVLAWMAAPEGSEEEQHLHDALELTCERAGTTTVAALVAHPLPVYVEGDE